MIAWIKGVLRGKDSESVVVDVGGLGYRVFVTSRTMEELPEEGHVVELRTHMVVREDAIQLYGFGEEAERRAFVLLTGINGVGPRLARLILSGLSPEGLAEAVMRGEGERLQMIPGVGKRTAQRILVELKDKVAGLQDGAKGLVQSSASSQQGGLLADVISVLMNLGYRASEARVAALRARDSLGGTPTLQDWVKEALRHLKTYGRSP